MKDYLMKDYHNANERERPLMLESVSVDVSPCSDSRSSHPAPRVPCSRWKGDCEPSLCHGVGRRENMWTPRVRYGCAPASVLGCDHATCCENGAGCGFVPVPCARVSCFCVGFCSCCSFPAAALCLVCAHLLWPCLCSCSGSRGGLEHAYLCPCLCAGAFLSASP